jgi:hypothetical protein
MNQQQGAENHPYLKNYSFGIIDSHGRFPLISSTIQQRRWFATLSAIKSVPYLSASGFLEAAVLITTGASREHPEFTR